MPYVKRPFNPLISIENQVISELEQANYNFEALANVFVGEDPIAGKVKRAQLSDSAINSQNSDMVDGFHASYTPAPNTLVPINSNGFLDLSSTYIKSNVYTFRRVNLTGSSYDYNLQVGEEAFISFYDAMYVFLRVSVGYFGLYEIFVWFNNYTSIDDFVFLFPNNTTYDGQFSHVSAYWSSSGASGLGVFTDTDNAFRLFNKMPHARMIIDVSRRIVQGTVSFEPNSGSVGSAVFSTKWKSSTTWLSLGCFASFSRLSGYTIIRRLA
jgi:hypothetical protein